MLCCVRECNLADMCGKTTRKNGVDSYSPRSQLLSQEKLTPKATGVNCLADSNKSKHNENSESIIE